MNDMQEEFALGLAAGLAPRRGAPAERRGTAVTVPAHWWFHLVCRTCGHTFRRGDRVRYDLTARTAEHLEPGLGCAGGPASEESGEAAEFTDGLLAGWPANVPVVRLAADDWRIPRPGLRTAAPKCRYCAHTFRPGEQVVVCPCQVARPVCGAAVHRDPARGLSCWERWRPDGRVEICPVAKARAAEND
ncbi:hypothetical protein ACFFWE_19650 [Sphaerisporangium melleum]|uniref:hypothetical protein n=1 Tax=Sphaerisporangium melleum TaxID=321316 RepID=UPI00166ECEF9|nr:hypothetical protein [Sphaerisporangium melleum]